MNTENTTEPETAEPTGSATYSPEDNKLRLYVGRVPRPEYEALRKQGWTSTPKQSCDFVAHWTPERRDTALDYAGVILDEDQGPAERAVERAERFGVYRDKRTNEATGHADRYDSGPAAHGFQNQARAERSAARHDRIAGRACDAWSKAEYWTSRTAGVIRHALHVSTPYVRMGRIKELESDIRKAEKRRAEYVAERERWQRVAAKTDLTKQNTLALHLAGGASDYWSKYQHPRQAKIDSLWDLLHADRCNGDAITGAEAAALYLAKHGELAAEGDWLTHYRLRLAYENQMMEACGGRAALVEMQVGGWINGKQIRKVVKSSASGLVTSVEVMGTFRSYNAGESRIVTGPILINVERDTADAYTPPTPEDVAAMEAIKKAEKAARPKVETVPLVNPTDADAEKLQDAINERARSEHTRRHGPNAERYGNAFKPAAVERITQAIYSANSKGAYARASTRGVGPGAEMHDEESNMWSKRRQDKAARLGAPLCTVRLSGYDPESVIILTDKPQKPFPAAVFEKPFALEAVTA